MEIYLPIAGMSVNVAVLLALGGGVGFLFGLFGAGGGLLLTPLLIFIGVPSPVAVASGANQVVAASVSGAMGHWRQGNVDLKMGAVLLAGGLAGSIVGAYAFSALQRLGHGDLTVGLSYVVVLGTIGTLMLGESVSVLIPWRRARLKPLRLRRHSFLHGLPLRMRFPRSKLYTSALLPLGIGFIVGVLAAIMGIGGSFIMIPAMIYLLGMPTSLVIGTSLFQTAVVTASVTYLHAINLQSVDVFLALLLLIGGAIGAQAGSRVSGLLKGEQLRGLMALTVLAAWARMGWLLIAEPADIYAATPIGY
jgi:uncharacterized membrane protein YfcA